MSRELLSKYAGISRDNKKKCFALGNWCNRQGNVFPMVEVFDCLYDAAGGNFHELSKLIEQLTSNGRVLGRSSVVFGGDDSSMSIVRGEDGNLSVRGYRDDFKRIHGQHNPHAGTMVKADGQISKNVKKAEERLNNIGREVREIYPGQSNEFITYAIAAIKRCARERKTSEMTIVNRLKSGRYMLDATEGIENAVIVPKRVVKINESQVSSLSDATKLTEYKFYNNVQRFLSDLLRDPVGAKVTFILSANGIDRKQLLYHLLKNGMVLKHQKISDTDSQGNPKTARMIVRYSVPKKDFAKKMKRLFISLVAKNVPEKVKKITVGDSHQYSKLKDNLKLMKGSPLTMGIVGHPEYGQTGEYAEIVNDILRKDIYECDGGSAMGATAGNESTGQVSSPLFGVQRRKMPYDIDETTTASSVTANGDISMGISVPFGADAETSDRTPGFSVRVKK